MLSNVCFSILKILSSKDAIKKKAMEMLLTAKPRGSVVKISMTKVSTIVRDLIFRKTLMEEIEISIIDFINVILILYF